MSWSHRSVGIKKSDGLRKTIEKESVLQCFLYKIMCCNETNIHFLCPNRFARKPTKYCRQFIICISRSRLQTDKHYKTICRVLLLSQAEYGNCLRISVDTFDWALPQRAARWRRVQVSHKRRALEALIANPAKTTPPFESPTTWPLSRCIFLSSSYSTLKEWMCQQIRSPGHRIKPSRSRIIQELSSNPRALRWGRWGTADMIARSTSSWRGKTSRHC